MRFLGINIPEEKRIEIGLTSIYGIGRPRAQQILSEANIDFGKRPKDISADEEGRIRKVIENLRLEGELRREIATNIKRLKDIRANRGLRHMKHLPVRGQRTKTNSRTVRGNVRKTMGSGKRKVEKT
jgi:small subunit ribosomal protein S13